MRLKLPPEIVTRQDLKAAIAELKSQAKWLSQATIKKQVIGSEAPASPSLSQAAQDLTSQWHNGQAITQKSLDELVAELNDFAAKATYVNITLAAPPPNSLKQEMVAWFRKNVRTDLLVDFSFNATMLGGMVVRCGSHVFDWSFKRQILANRAKFPGVLRNV